MEENKHRQPRGKSGESGFGFADICMIAEGPSETERFVSQAAVEKKDGAVVCAFAHDGARFRVAAGKRPRIEREGEISYVLSFDPQAETETCIRSAFGEIFVRVRTLCVRCACEERKILLDCAYVLDFAGDVQQHRLRFSARLHGEGGEWKP